MAEKTQATSSPALSMTERSERRRPPLPKVAPWLVIPYGKDRKNQAFYNLCDPDKRTCRKLIPELSGKSIFQKPCHQGWLVVACDDNKVDYSPTWSYGDFFLWNPATLETIQLPNINSSGYTFDDYYLVDCVLSSPPRSNNPSDGNDTMVFFVYERLDNECEYVFLYCRPGDKQWSTQKFTRQKHKMGPNFIVSLNYLKGDFYATSYSRVCLFKIEIQQIEGNDVHLCISQIEISSPFGSPTIGGSCTNVRRLYVQTCDELYKIDLSIAHQGDEFISIVIMRLDFLTMGWKEVNSLGDIVLFYSKNTTACCSAAELGLTRGCLYYTLPKDQSLYKYELEGTGTIVLPCLKLPTPWFCSNWIMMPPTFRVGDGQRGTKFMLDKREEEDYIINLKPKTTILAGNNNENPEEICSSDEVKQQTPWSILNKDSLHMISSYLHPIDYKFLRSVCKENRLNLSLGKQRSTSNRFNTCLSPWLLFSIKNDCTIYNLVDPMDNNENYFMERPLLRGAIIRFQKGGWLLMSEGAHKLFFHNPFTKETIQLPDFPDYYGLSKILFSSLPTCSDCVVFGIGESDKRGGGVQVYWIARGEKYWKYQEFCDIDTYEYYMPLLNTPVLYKGILYCVDYNGLLGTFSLESWSYKVLPKPSGTFNREHPSFLVECGGDLLLVKLGRIGKSLKIFKLDFSKMEWVRVKSLGKHTLFISYTSCVSRIAPCTSMENKIYFPRLSLHGEGVLLYSLDTGVYHSVGNQNSSKDFSDTKGWSSWTWIEPSWSRSATEELDWLTLR